MEQISEPQFKRLEEDVLEQVMSISKAMLETFKFAMIHQTKVPEKTRSKTTRALQEFRAKHWNKDASIDEAYKKYLSLY